MKKKTIEQQLRADQQNWYDYMNTTQVKLKLNNKTDADIKQVMNTNPEESSHISGGHPG